MATDGEDTSKHACIKQVLLSLPLCALLFGLAYFIRGQSIQALAGIGIAISGYLVVALIERFSRPAGPRKSRHTWWMHFNITLITITSFVVIGPIFSILIAKWIASVFGFELGLIDLRFNGYSGFSAVLGATVVSAIATDFLYYWFHRTMHAVPLFWQHHKLHHMDPAFDALTSQRTGWLEAVFEGGMIALPSAILFKFSQNNFLDVGIVTSVTLYLFLIVNFLNHSNLRLQYGVLSWLWVSPQVHRIHHSLQPEHFDKNFVAVFPLWDILFGTYYAPKKDEFPYTGVEGEQDIKSVWEAQVFTLREWWKMFRAWRARHKSIQPNRENLKIIP